jgi:hypothetical protein
MPLENYLDYDYALYMTLFNRNIVFKAGIVFSLFCLLISAAVSLQVINIYTAMTYEISRRSAGFFNILAGKFLNADLLAVHCCILGMVLYSLFSIVLLYRFFEKTQSPEIIFVGFFAASFLAEVLRLILPLGWAHEIPSLYLLIATRIMLFGRYFGIFSLFTASVYAVSFEAQRQRNVIIIVIVISLIIALGIPVDTQVWDSSLVMIHGINSMCRLIEIGIFIVTVISFFVAVWSRGSREFIYIGIGTILAFVGRAILLGADTWAGLPGGMLFLIIGTWLICTKLHKIYLWL